MDRLSEQQWRDFDENGFVRLGQLLEPESIVEFARRADELASGTLVNPQIQLQLDTGGDYDALPGVVSQLTEGTRLYRKVQGLEHDELFLPLVRHPVFEGICARLYGPHAPVSLFRAMIMNKPAGQGTYLPWHQDGGDVWALDRDPLVTVWVALDPATRANGCLEVIPGSHRLGLLSERGSTLSTEDAERHCPADRVLSLELEAGHGLLLHNWLLHRSGINPSSQPRRAFTACYLDGRTRGVLTGNHFPVIFGRLDPAPHHYVRQLHVDLAALRHAHGTAEHYAHDLEAEVERLRAKLGEAESYARSLEQERAARLLQDSTVPLQASAAPRRGWLARLRGDGAH
ncbi:hypothetical protein HNP49_000890 [Pseudomonas fluvialis]|uniref:Phytanoyl-CoA dioxygenase n=1 Tax=Pseudomonas fluvialis TaxID=1793966 RepID=A0A7X0BS16_9PSED|nr:phytanoyl-CoA dioxygenase family protein [Pseudomonas fluvialis]MBB6340740.1 hypothetical protein [Pseudomonas fluvialis]